VSKEFTHEPDAHRYVLRIDGSIAAVAEYRRNGLTMSFNHTYTAPHLRGRGLAAEIVEFAVDDVDKTTDNRILPMCWYVGEWFDKNPERAHLLTR